MKLALKLLFPEVTTPCVSADPRQIKARPFLSLVAGSTVVSPLSAKLIAQLPNSWKIFAIKWQPDVAAALQHWVACLLACQSAAGIHLANLVRCGIGYAATKFDSTFLSSLLRPHLSYFSPSTMWYYGPSTTYLNMETVPLFVICCTPLASNSGVGITEAAVVLKTI